MTGGTRLVKSFTSIQFLLTIAGQAPQFQMGRKSPIISLSHHNNLIQAPNKLHYKSRIRRCLFPSCAHFLPSYYTSLKDTSDKNSKAALGHFWFSLLSHSLKKCGFFGLFLQSMPSYLQFQHSLHNKMKTEKQ